MTAAFQDDLAAAAVDAEFTGSSRLVDSQDDYDYVLIVDVANLAHRSAWGNPDLATSAGERSGHVFGSLRSVVTLFEKNLPAGRWLMVRCHEGEGAKAHRRQWVPGYKGNREERTWDPIQGVKEAMAALPGLDVEMPEHEGDDAVVSAVDYFASYGFVPFVFSGDRDLWTLVDRAAVWSPNLGRQVTREDLLDKFKLQTPERLPLLKAVCGDASDNIKGVERFQTKVAAAAVDAIVAPTVDDLYAHLLAGKLSDKTRAKLLAARETVEANFRVTSHRRFYLPDGFALLPHPSIDATLRRYECKSLEKWGKALAGEADFTVYGEVDA